MNEPPPHGCRPGRPATRIESLIGSMLCPASRPRAGEASFLLLLLFLLCSCSLLRCPFTAPEKKRRGKKREGKDIKPPARTTCTAIGPPAGKPSVRESGQAAWASSRREHRRGAGGRSGEFAVARGHLASHLTCTLLSSVEHLFSLLSCTLLSSVGQFSLLQPTCYTTSPFLSASSRASQTRVASRRETETLIRTAWLTRGKTHAHSFSSRSCAPT